MTSDTFQDLVIEERFNPYRECVQGRANEPICVQSLLDKSRAVASTVDPSLDPGPVSLSEIVRRLVINRPRIAVITGSPDHPAHLRDELHISLAALRIWRNGGVPFVFGIPVICDGTAQNNIGQSYSLVSRNITAAAVNITFEGHSYHAAYVLSSCDKFPSAVLSGLAAADVARGHKDRGQAPVWSLFVPSHVLRGGTVNQETCKRLHQVIDNARRQGFDDLAADITDTMRYILQCSSAEAFWGQMQLAVQHGLLGDDEGRAIMDELAVATCHRNGGICAFNGTGNSSRTLVAALGLTPPQAELLMDVPSPEVVGQCVDMLYRSLNHTEYRVTTVLGRNFANAVRIHNATGSSSNILLHLPAIMRYAGFAVSIDDYEKIRSQTPVPEIFAHSLTENRDTFILAQQYARGQHHGMASLYRVLTDLGCRMDLDAPTMTGQNWGERIAALREPVSAELGEDAIIRTTPVRQTSGVEVLRGNFMSSAVIKLAGMSDRQLRFFDEHLFIVRYYENEQDCVREMGSPAFIENLRQIVEQMPEAIIEAILAHNSKAELRDYSHDGFSDLLKKAFLSFAFVIAGQGPKAFGMPEMYVPSQSLKHHQLLEASSLLITDGRYSGVTKGACIGHVTPEAFAGGGIGRLIDGDVMFLQIIQKRLSIIDPAALEAGRVAVLQELPERRQLVAGRVEKMRERSLQVAASNMMTDVTSAEKGCVPSAVDLRAVACLP